MIILLPKTKTKRILTKEEIQSKRQSMYKYETHCHTSPVSFCAKASVAETVQFYKSRGYAGLFITNHFLDGNICPSVKTLPYKEQLDFYFSDFEAGVREGEKIGISVFPGVELSYKGTDFIIYGLDKYWFQEHPEIMEMKKTEELQLMMDSGALVIQAHPYREEHYINHIRLFPRHVHGVEVVNTSQKGEANEMAALYAKHYHLLETCGSDNHWAGNVFEKLRGKGLKPEIAGMCSETPVVDVRDFMEKIFSGKMKPFIEAE